MWGSFSIPHMIFRGLQQAKEHKCGVGKDLLNNVTLEAVWVLSPTYAMEIYAAPNDALLLMNADRLTNTEAFK